MEATARAVLITGGSSGIGLSTGRLLASQGYRVAIVGRDAARLKAAGAEIAGGNGVVPGRVHVVSADLTEELAAARVFGEVVEHFGAVDAVVNSAGSAPAGDPFELTDADWRSALDLKFFGALRIMRAAAAHMKPRGSGRIVNVVGTAAREPTARLATAAVANAALLALTKSASRALAPHGISVNAVNPGPTSTGRWAGLVSAYAEMSGDPSDVVEKSLTSAIPMGRPAMPTEVAAAVGYLLSVEAAYVTGTAIDVDGGALGGI